MKRINTYQDFDRAVEQGKEVYIQAKLLKRLTHGEYIGEADNGFETSIGTFDLDFLNIFDIGEYDGTFSLSDVKHILLLSQSKSRDFLMSSCDGSDYVDFLINVWDSEEITFVYWESKYRDIVEMFDDINCMRKVVKLISKRETAKKDIVF